MSRTLYIIAVYLTIPYALWRLLRRHGGFQSGGSVPWREYFGFAPRQGHSDTSNQSAPLLWMHSVSLGEAIAAAPLARQLQSDGYRLLLTYTTPAGRDWLREQYPQALVCALPLDTPSAVRRFFTRLRPVAGIIMEAEYWPNLLLAAKAYGVPLMLANARLGKKNARRYARVASLMRRLVACFDVIAAQTPRDAGRLRCFGARHVCTAGNLKFELPPPPVATTQVLRRQNKSIVLFAATRPGEEQLLLDAAGDDFWRDCFVILAPRHPHRAANLSALLDAKGLRHRVRSCDNGSSGGGAVDIDDGCAVYLADTLGEMHEWYASCDVAVIGGSFLPYGGQNPIEAMRAGVAAVIGSHADNYARLVRRAVSAGAMAQASDASGALARVRQLLEDGAARAAMQKAARKFYEQCGGALEQHLLLARQLLAGREQSKTIEG